ncbi:MAG: acyl carrier protein [Flavobacteriaceae bacterium]|nr:acyl carrier protein [Flavobacteriaceae bacterium]
MTYPNKTLQRPSLEKKIIKIIINKLGLLEGEVSFDSNLVSDLGADELDLVELVMEVEKEFDIQIEDAIAYKIRTVGQYITYIKSLV